MKYSVVLPVHNEEGNIQELHQRLTTVMRGLEEPYEIIYVENRSTDNTVAILKSLNDAKVLVMRLPLFTYRTTQSIALDAGIKHAQGEIIITLDSDLQNPPEEIPKLLKKLEADNLDVVSGWRQKRKDSFIIRTLSKIGSILRKAIINPGVHDLGCTLKVYRRECFEGLTLQGEMHRYLVAILRWKGFQVGEVVVAHHARKTGNSSYTWAKIFRGFVDMWSIWFWKKYADRPLHLFGVWGVLATATGSGLLFILAALRIFGLISLSESIWPLIAVLFIISGIQLFAFGMIMDMVIKNYYATGREPLYTFKEVIEV